MRKNVKLIESLISSSLKRLERGFRVLEWETLHFCCSHLNENKCVNFLYIKRKKLIKLIFFVSEDFSNIKCTRILPKKTSKPYIYYSS